MQNSEEYLFSIKMTNFKIVLEKLIETFEYLEDENDIDKGVQIGKELIEQFDMISEKFNILQEKIDKLERKNSSLNDDLEENEIILDNLRGENTIIKHDIEKLKKSLKDISDKLHKTQENSNEIEADYQEKIQTLQKEIEVKDKNNKEVCKHLKEVRTQLELKINEYNKLVETTEKNKKDIDQQNQKSISYIEKLNEGNTKAIHRHIEKEKQLELEIEKYKNILSESEDIKHEVEKYNVELNKVIDNIKPEITNLQEKLKESIHTNEKLQREIEYLRMCKDLNDDSLNEPLINNNHSTKQNNNDKCRFCCMC